MCEWAVQVEVNIITGYLCTTRRSLKLRSTFLQNPSDTFQCQKHNIRSDMIESSSASFSVRKLLTSKSWQQDLLWRHHRAPAARGDDDTLKSSAGMAKVKRMRHGSEQNTHEPLATEWIFMFLAICCFWALVNGSSRCFLILWWRQKCDGVV